MTGSIKILFCYFIYIFSIFIVRSILSFYWFDLQYTPKNLYNSIMKEEAFLNVVKLFSELLSDTFYFSVTERVYYFREQSNIWKSFSTFPFSDRLRSYSEMVSKSFLGNIFPLS